MALWNLVVVECKVFERKNLWALDSKKVFILCNQNEHKQDKVNTADSAFIFLIIQSKSMVRLVRAEKMVLSGLVFAGKMARMILIQNI